MSLPQEIINTILYKWNGFAPYPFVKELNDINYSLLHPDKMIWGKMTEEECEDAFNDVTNSIHEDWGTKSYCILDYIGVLQCSFLSHPKYRSI